MNLLRNTIVYTAGPLEATKDNGGEWRDKLKEALEPIGVKVLDPTKPMFVGDSPETEERRQKCLEKRGEGDYEYVRSIFKPIIQKDLRLVDLASFFIVNFIDYKIPTWGTMHELIVANQQKKPIIVVGKGNPPLWMIGLLPAETFFQTLEAAISYIKKIDSGDINLNTERWKILP